MAERPRFWKSLWGDRRTGSDRRRQPRPEPPEDRRSPRESGAADHGGRRHSVRHPVPFGPGSPSGALINAAGHSVHIALWDVSEGGLCVVTRSVIKDRPGSLMVVELHSGVGVENVRLEMQLVWSATEEGRFGTFVGLQFPEGHQLPNGTFLDLFLVMDLPN